MSFMHCNVSPNAVFYFTKIFLYEDLLISQTSFSDRLTVLTSASCLNPRVLMGPWYENKMEMICIKARLFVNLLYAL